MDSPSAAADPEILRFHPARECPQLAAVPGAHQGHHVHQLRQNRYRCLDCKDQPLFRLVKASIGRRRRLLR